jgi:SAM-dependent methyltransferase
VDLGEASDQWGGREAGAFAQLLADAGVTSITHDLEELPFPLSDASFDAAILTEVLEHLREYPAATLTEIRRTLRPEGRLYLSTPNVAYLVNRARVLVGRNIYTPLEDWIGGLPHARHAREYTFGEVEELLAHAGFVVISAESRHLYTRSGRESRPARSAKKAINALARIRPTLGPAIIVVAKPA